MLEVSYHTPRHHTMLTLTEKSQINSQYMINHYEPGCVTINEHKHLQNCLISPKKIAPWPVTSVDLLNTEQCQAVIELNPDLFLIGTGQKFATPPAKIIHHLYQHGIACDYMNNAAACRTFMALCSDGRSVVLGLFL